jgi:hypothetical protein
MVTVRGDLIFATGRRVKGISIRLYELPHRWSGALQVPPEFRGIVADAFRRRLECNLLVEDGREGTILLTGLGVVARFEGLGPLLPPTQQP